MDDNLASSATAAAPTAVRLEALRRYDILDTPKEHDFDNIVELAASVFDAPIAIVNFIADGRQWFKAETGIGVRELPLDVSICAHALLEQDFLVVPDTRLDPRFDCNPLVTADNGLRFYAGALLRTEDGIAIGTVCVLDRTPRPDGITPQQRLALSVLAKQVMTILDLRAAVSAQSQQVSALQHAARTEERYGALFEAIDDGFCIIEFFDGPHGPLSDYVHIVANAGYERHSGIADIVGKTLRDLEPEDAANKWIDFYGAVLRTGEPVRFESYFETAGRYIEVSGAVRLSRTRLHTMHGGL